MFNLYDCTTRQRKLWVGEQLPEKLQTLEKKKIVNELATTLRKTNVQHNDELLLLFVECVYDIKIRIFDAALNQWVDSEALDPTHTNVISLYYTGDHYEYKRLGEIMIEVAEKEKKTIEQDHLEKANALYEKKKEDGPVDMTDDTTREQLRKAYEKYGRLRGGDPFLSSLQLLSLALDRRAWTPDIDEANWHIYTFRKIKKMPLSLYKEETEEVKGVHSKCVFTVSAYSRYF